MKVWYIAKSKPQKETWLMASLAALGVEVFYPGIVCERRGQRVLEPLFPTYVFCRLEAETLDWPAIRWAPGLNYFLGADGRPTQVKDDLVLHIRHRADTWNNGARWMEEVHPGQAVKVTSGPFAGLDGIFQRHVNSRQRCRVLLQAVGLASSVDMVRRDLAVSAPRL